MKLLIKQFLFSYVLSMIFVSTAYSVTLIAVGNRILEDQGGIHASFSQMDVPLIDVSIDKGENWIKTSIDSSINKKGTLRSNSCVDVDCVSVGMLFSDDIKKSEPLTAISHNGGLSWNFEKLTQLPLNELIDVSCVKSGSTARCVVLGREYKENKINSYILVSENGGEIWKTTFAIEDASLEKISCSGHGSATICSIIGESLKESILLTSRNGGETWVNSYDSLKLPKDVYYKFHSTVCTGNGEDARCVVTAGDYSDKDPQALLIVSTDGALTWNIKKLAVNGAPFYSYLNTSTCTGEGTNAICVAAGKRLGKHKYPVTVFSMDGGLNWNIKTQFEGEGYISSVSCTGEKLDTICAAVGFSGNKMLLLSGSVVNFDGIYWTRKWDPYTPDFVKFSSVSCSGSGSTAICITEGKLSDDLSIILVSTDGGSTWKKKYHDDSWTSSFNSVSSNLN